MKRGPKEVPTALKLLHGNPGKRVLNIEEPEGRGALWDPPAWLDETQREQWRYSVENAPLGLLTATDREVMVIWTVACVEHARAAFDVRRLGQVIKTKDGNIIQNPYVGVMNRQALIMLRAAADLGFSPAARTSIGRGAQALPEDPEGRRTTGPSAGLNAYLNEKPDRLN